MDIIARLYRPDISTLIADHGLVAQLQTVVRIQNGEICSHQSSETIIKMNPAGVAGDGHVSNTHFRFVQVTRGYDRDWHHHLVQISFQTTRNLKQRTSFLISSCSTSLDVDLLSFL